MDDAGYTLVEVLAALLIIGLTLGSLAGAVKVVGDLQARGAGRVQQAERMSALANDLQHLVDGQGPFSSAGGISLSGDQNGFRFNCFPSVCSAALKTMGRSSTLVVRGPEGSRNTPWASDHPLKFRYIGSRESSDHWPPDNPTNWQRLRAISLSRKDEPDAPLLVARIWTEGASSRPVGAP